VLIAQCCDLKCGELIHVIGDCHVYLNHQEALEEQLKNKPVPFPILPLKPLCKDIDEFKIEDIQVIGYVSHPPIKMDFN